MKKLPLLFAATVLLASGSGWADDDAEATIRLMGKAEAELPDAVTKLITLPEHLFLANPEDRVAAVEKAEKGLAKANERHANRETGQDHAAEMKEKANEKRETRGRSEDHPSPPETPPGKE